METFKILKFRTPLSIHSKFSLSKRKETLLITPLPADDFISRSTEIWNTLTAKLKITDFSPSIGSMKSMVRQALFKNQQTGDATQWIPNNFEIVKILPV